MTWFNKQSKLVQILLLLIPVVNWFTEIVVRWSTWLKKGGLIRLIVCVLVTIPSGIVIGWLDLLWVLLFGEFFLQQSDFNRFYQKPWFFAKVFVFLLKHKILWLSKKIFTKYRYKTLTKRNILWYIKKAYNKKL